MTTILRATPEFLPHEVAIAEELIDAYLIEQKESGYHILVAESDGRVVGYVCYGETPMTEGTWDIYWLAVDRQMRGKGIGGALMNEAERLIRVKHGRLAVIETSGKPDYYDTISFHNKQGYAEIARIPDFYTIGDDKVIMIKRLE